MDDGLQFANEDRSNWPAGPDTTKTIYKVGARYVSGVTWDYIGNDKAEFDAALAKFEARNARIAAMKGWKPSPTEIVTEIIEPEPIIEPDQDTVSQPVVESVEVAASAAPATEEQFEIAETGTVEVYVEAGRPTGRFLAYRGDSFAAAKAVVAQWVGKCSHVITRSRAFDGCWVWHEPGKYNRAAQGLSWNGHEEYLKNFDAGVFDRAFYRDWLNDEFAGGRMTARQCDEALAAFEVQHGR